VLQQSLVSCRAELRSTARAIAVLACVGLALLWLPAVAFAEGDGDGCNPYRSNNESYHPQDGLTANAPNLGSVGGMSGQIYNYSPFVYNFSSGPIDATTQWVMLVGADGSYAQIGWWEQVYGQRYTFVETYVGSGSVAPNTFYAADPTNSVSTYEVAYRSGTFDFYDNGSGDGSWGHSYTPVEGQSFGETRTTASQMPGGILNQSYMYQGELFYPAGSGGSWNYIDSGSSTTHYQNFSGYPAFGDANFAGEITEPHGYQIYDDYCLY
jgi:hypothetical protein